jgi:hypothetical protein
MATRITNAHLDNLCDEINEKRGTPLNAWTRQEDGKLRANVGNVHIYDGGGLYSLHEMANESGGVCRIFTGRTKRELFDQMVGYASGLNYSNK